MLSMTKFKHPDFNTKNNKSLKVAENKHAWAFPTRQPIVPGHLLIVPKRTVPKFNQLSSKEILAIHELLETLKPALSKLYRATGFNHAWNENPSAGQTVGQLHVHLVPRNEGDVSIHKYEPRKFLYRPHSRTNSPQEELQQVAEQIKNELIT